MMGQGFADGIGKSIIMGIVLLVSIAFSIGLLSAWFIPKLWIFLKPIIHTATAL